MRRFQDRRDAGLQLAARLSYFRDERPIVLGLPRGGVPVAFEVARALDAPLDVIVVRKLGVPFQPELGMGAIGEDGARPQRRCRSSGAGDPDELAAVEARERREVERRARPLSTGPSDDPARRAHGDHRRRRHRHGGHCTGRARGGPGTRRTSRGPRGTRGTRDSIADMAALADEVVVIETPTPFYAVGEWYTRFTQTPDDDVISLLEAAARGVVAVTIILRETPIHRTRRRNRHHRHRRLRLSGHLTIPGAATGVVIFAHGSGSSRHSPRNQFVARQSQRVRASAPCSSICSRRRGARPRQRVRHRAPRRPAPRRRPLVAPAARPRRPRHRLLRCEHRRRRSAVGGGRRPCVRAVVSRAAALTSPCRALLRSTRPPCSSSEARDTHVLHLNRQAAAEMSCEHRIEVVPRRDPPLRGAGHARSRRAPGLRLVRVPPRAGTERRRRERRPTRFKETLSPAKPHVEGDCFGASRALPGPWRARRSGRVVDRRRSSCRCERRSRDLRPPTARARARRPGQACPRHGSLPRSP